jgi:putative NADPH-quinone reductase
MAGRSILIIQGHPDREASHFCHALAEAYHAGAESAGLQVDELRLADLDFPCLRSEREWKQPPPPVIAEAQARIRDADHLVLVYPLWMGTMPALVKAFLEQTLRPDFAFDEAAREGHGQRLLKGKSARVLVTMGMPGFLYRWFFGAHGYFYLKRNILQFCGIKPVRHSFIGLVAAKEDRGRQKWLAKVRAMGQRAT